MDEINGLENLLVWQKAMEFSVHLCQSILNKLPNNERYALIPQLRRSVQSIPANIAEGYGRYYYQESVRFCYIARGSLEETNNHLVFAYKMGYIVDEEFTLCKQQIVEIRRMINGYISYLKKSKRGMNEPGARHLTTGEEEPA